MTSIHYFRRFINYIRKEENDNEKRMKTMQVNISFLKWFYRIRRQRRTTKKTSKCLFCWPVFECVRYIYIFSFLTSAHSRHTLFIYWYKPASQHQIIYSKYTVRILTNICNLNYLTARMKRKKTIRKKVEYINKWEAESKYYCCKHDIYAKCYHQPCLTFSWKLFIHERHTLSICTHIFFVNERY